MSVGANSSVASTVARIHRQLDLDRVLPVLKHLESDAEIGWRVRDALDDIDVFRLDR